MLLGGDYDGDFWFRGMEIGEKEKAPSLKKGGLSHSILVVWKKTPEQKLGN